MRQANPGLDPERALKDWKQAATPADPWSCYQCQLVTPLYGGGVRAGEVDEGLPIRPSGIRGQLRFWWRLACGPFESPAAMFQGESEIWGGITGKGPIASRVAVKVESQTAKAPDLIARSQQRNFPAYALILDPGADPRLLRSDYRFKVALRFASDLTNTQRDQVVNAIRWWASFGGVGARTRRGLGAFKVMKSVELPSPVSPAEVEAKGGRLVLQSKAKDANDAWEQAVNALQRFRQGPNLGRKPGTANHPGRSLWPEADELRALSEHALPRHAKRLVSANVFARAAFGLPIVFHFKDAPTNHDRRNDNFMRSDFDPDDHILEPADLSANDRRDRLASPLILRPYWNGKEWRPAALLLPGWKDALGIPLKFKTQGYTPRAWQSDQELAAQIEPMAGRGDDPLSAFMDFFEKG